VPCCTSSRSPFGAIMRLQRTVLDALYGRHPFEANDAPSPARFDRSGTSRSWLSVLRSRAHFAVSAGDAAPHVGRSVENGTCRLGRRSFRPNPSGWRANLRDMGWPHRLILVVLGVAVGCTLAAGCSNDSQSAADVPHATPEASIGMGGNTAVEIPDGLGSTQSEAGAGGDAALSASSSAYTPPLASPGSSTPPGVGVGAGGSRTSDDAPVELRDDGSVEADAGPPRPLPEFGLDAMDDPIDNPELCPVQAPALGEPCPQYELVCKYGSELFCRSRVICGRNDTWGLFYGARDCPESCPASEPNEGEPCEVDNTQCTFGERPICRSHWLCWQGQWALLRAGRDCESDAYCPQQPPRTGASCEQDEFTPLGEVCIYPGAETCSCGCYLEPGGDTPIRAWNCHVHYADQPPDYLSACPLEPPTIGDACEFDGGSCVFNLTGQCRPGGAGQIRVQCQNLVWVDVTPEEWRQ